MIKKTFADFGLRSETVESLKIAGIDSPFEIQELTLPSALEGKDIIGQAKTGTGKTFAFGLPLLEKINGGNKIPKAIIILPTRELAIQVEKELKVASQARTDKVKIALLYGGTDIKKQAKQLSDGCDIIVGTPGRILDMIKHRHLDLSEAKYLVLDEADQMLNFGFIDDIREIIDNLPSKEERQTLLFSATLPGEIMLLARKGMNNPIRISTIGVNETSSRVDQIDNFVFRVHYLDKPDFLAKMLQKPNRGKTIIFTQQKFRAEKTANDLKDRGFNVFCLQGNMGQNARERALAKFKNADLSVRGGEAAILVATDVAARGIDIEGITLVVNYECPDDSVSYIHRTGRTGRAGEKGTAVTFVDWEDMKRWKNIAEELNLEDIEPEESYSSQDEWKDLLGISHDVKNYLKEVPKDSKTSSKDSKNNSRNRNSKQHNRGQKNTNFKKVEISEKDLKPVDKKRKRQRKRIVKN
ncbi:MAG: DEAD/DEAH box helicase [Candidatus Ancillula sp.]|jgi:superfamily II DNA/RNA helicase|nr:DEAD/DEAH box helicase [Candidatus Ancillula sp.]